MTKKSYARRKRDAIKRAIAKEQKQEFKRTGEIPLTVTFPSDSIKEGK